MKEREEEQGDNLTTQKNAKIRACGSYTKQKIYVKCKTEKNRDYNDKFRLSVKETIKGLFDNASDILKISKNWMKNNEPVLRLIYVYLLY